MFTYLCNQGKLQWPRGIELNAEAITRMQKSQHINMPFALQRFLWLLTFVFFCGVTVGSTLLGEHRIQPDVARTVPAVEAADSGFQWEITSPCEGPRSFETSVPN